MSFQLIFKAPARIEYAEAVAWYEQQRAGLGKEFSLDVEHALKRAQTNPERFSKVHRQARKIRLQRFSRYSIYFAVKDDAFSILAVFHSSRNPEELFRRLG
jgi:toxin ParE1/3/4